MAAVWQWEAHTAQARDGLLSNFFFLNERRREKHLDLAV